MKTPVKLLFTASILFNAFAVAYFATNMCKGDSIDYREKRLEALADKLSADKAALLREGMKVMEEERKEAFDKVKGLRKEIHTILTAEDFDAEAFRMRSHELGALFHGSKGHAIEVIVDIANELDQDERKLLAEALKKKR